MLSAVLRMVISLAVVLALMYAAARLLHRFHGAPSSSAAAGRSAFRGVRRALLGRGGLDPAPQRPTRVLEVLARQPLGKSAGVAVLRVGDRTVLLGVTDQRVELLGEVTLPGPPVRQVKDGHVTRTPVPLDELLRYRTGA